MTCLVTVTHRKEKPDPRGRKTVQEVDLRKKGRRHRCHCSRMVAWVAGPFALPRPSLGLWLPYPKLYLGGKLTLAFGGVTQHPSPQPKYSMAKRQEGCPPTRVFPSTCHPSQGDSEPTLVVYWMEVGRDTS